MKQKNSDDMEYKLQTYIRMIGIIRRNFGKEVTTQIKVRTYNITLKARKYEPAFEKLGSNTDDMF
jgi:hypothetical protein